MMITCLEKTNNTKYNVLKMKLKKKIQDTKIGLFFPLHSCCSQRKSKCLKFDSTDWIKVCNEVTPQRKYTHRSWFGLFTENIS